MESAEFEIKHVIAAPCGTGCTLWYCPTQLNTRTPSFARHIGKVVMMIMMVVVTLSHGEFLPTAQSGTYGQE